MGIIARPVNLNERLLMNEEMIYVLPTKEKKKLNKTKFIVFCLLASLGCSLVVSLLIIPSVGTWVCGFVPISLVATCCAVAQIIGTVFYIRKHKYAHGDNYELYQIINSVIYGIQNVLRILLVVVLINICAAPVFALVITIYILFLIRKIFRR